MVIERKAVRSCRIGTSLQTTSSQSRSLSLVMEATKFPATFLPIDLWMEIFELVDPLDILALMQVRTVSLSNPCGIFLNLDTRFLLTSTLYSVKGLFGFESSGWSADRNPFSLGPIHSTRCHSYNSRRRQQHLLDGGAAFGPT